jgi:hypothetical protein
VSVAGPGNLLEAGGKDPRIWSPNAQHVRGFRLWKLPHDGRTLRHAGHGHASSGFHTCERE